MLGIYRLSFDCGRDTLDGLFVESEEKVNALVESKVEVYFGEALGKHSEIYGPIEPKEVELLTTDQSFISKFQEFKLSTGFNPFHYETIEGESVSDLVDEFLKKEK